MKYEKESRYMWDTFVPKRGQADTVQGELIRAIERLWDESHRNGNGNWDEGYEIFCDFIRDTLCNSGIFNKETQDQIVQDIKTIRKPKQPYLKDDIYERLSDLIVEWYKQNPNPIPNPHNPRQSR